MWTRIAIAGLAATFVSSAAWAARPTAGALAPDRLKLPSGPSSVKGLAEEAEVDPFYAQLGYSVPIETPLGYGGLAPSLALAYSGALGNGPLGIGWVMPGARIERSLRLGVPTFTAADELVLVGGALAGRLVAIGGGEYRLEGNGQTVRVRAVGAGFEVDGGDGTRRRFGLAPGARQESGGRTAAWLLEEETNLAGERIAYEYTHDQNQVYLARIAWGPQQAFAVELAYATRPDPTTSYREGFRVVTARRLDRIRIVAFAGERRAYVMRYDDTFAVSRLAGVTSTGRDGIGAWPALAFEYATPAAASVVAMPGVGTWRLNANGASLVDLDGDGAAELLELADGGHRYRVNQNGSFGPPLPLTGNTQSITALQLMDIDGDARADLLQDTGSGWTVWKWTKTKWLPQPGIWPGSSGLALKSPSTTRFADLDGDGLVDAIRWDNDNLKVYDATRTGFAPVRLVPRIGGVALPAADGRFQDANGDGLDDYIVVRPDGLDLYTGRGDGTFEPVVARAYPFAGQTSNIDDIHLVDLDRDDLLDLVRVDLGTVRWFRGTATGGFTTTPITVASPEPLNADVVVTVNDVNGNGSQDVVWSSASNMWRLDIAGPTSAGMLTRTQNGLGQDVRFTYRSAHDLSVEARLANDPWQYELPVAMPVPVRKTTALGPGETTRQIDYVVRDGFWDASERRFGGFLGSLVTTWGATPAQTSVVQRRYHNGTGVNRELRGKPLVEQVRDGAGHRLSVATHTWEAMVIAGLPDVPQLRTAVLRETRKRFEDTIPIRETRIAYEYDALGRVFRTIDHGRLDVTGDEATQEQRYADDPTTWVRDRPCEDKLFAGDGTLVSHTQTLYGDETAAMQPLYVAGKGWARETRSWLAGEDRWIPQTETTYDAHGNALAVRTQGVTRSLGYDADGLFAQNEIVEVAPGELQTWTTAWDRVIGQPIALADPNGHVARASYDALGRYTGVAIDARPQHQRVEYDWTTASPTTTLWEFDGTVAELTAAPATWTPTGKWRQSVSVANGNGEVRYRAVRRDTAEWIISDYVERDPASRIVFAGRPIYATTAVHASRPAGIAGDQLSYDPLGRVIDQRLPTGARRVFTYTAFERTLAEDSLAPVHTVFDGRGCVTMTERALADGTHEIVTARCDAAGRIVEMALSGGAVTRTFAYDTLGRLVASSDPDLGTRTMRYNDAGKLTGETNASGQTIRYGYDLAGRLVERDTGSSYRYHYDHARPGGIGSEATRLAGRIAWIEEPTGVVELGYDELGRGIVARREVADHAVTETTTYTASGLVAERAYDDGLTLAYTYDHAARQVAISDAVSPIWQLLDQDASGAALHERFRNGATTHYLRDALGMTAGVTVRDGGGTARYDVAIARNGWTAIESVSDLDGVGLDHSAAYTYDGFARLASAQIGTGKYAPAFQYRYDALHNMIERSSTIPLAGVFTGTYRYGENGQGPRQLTSITDPNASHTFAFDPAGREVARDGLTMTYDAADRLISVDGLKKGTLTHAYGYDGARVQTTNPDGTMAYWFAPGTADRLGRREHDIEVGGRLIARVVLDELDESAAGGHGGLLGAGVLGALLVIVLVRAAQTGRARRAAFGLAIAAACSPTATTSTTRSTLWGDQHWIFAHAGVAAGPALFTDEHGDLLEERQAEPFGAELAPADLGERDRNALNQRTEVATGWSDHGARWLAPDTARWLTPDPPIQAPDVKFMLAPWDLHPYQYVAQNPVTYWDPDGRDKRRTFTDAEVQTMFWWFFTNANKGVNPVTHTTRGNTDLRYRCSCIGTVNHGMEALFGEKPWAGSTPSKIDDLQDKMWDAGLALGEKTVKYDWKPALRTAADPQAIRAVQKQSPWDTVVALSQGEPGWTVNLVSIAGGWHSVTVLVHNDGTHSPTVIFADQNVDNGWKEFTAKGDFDAYMADWQDLAGSAYTDPARRPRPLKRPPDSRYVRVGPDD